MRRGGARRWWVTTLLALVLLLGTGCQVTLTAGIDASPNGSGTVRAGIGLDADALKQLGDPSKALRLDDLRQAGWAVTGPEKESDGLTWIRLSKHFGSPDEGNRIAADLSGPDGPFGAIHLSRQHSLFKTKTMLTGTVDLTKGLTGLSDPALQAALAGADLHLDLAGLRQQLGPDPDHALAVRLEADLPGSVTSNATGHAGQTLLWQPKLGEAVRVEARSEAWNWGTIVAILAVVLSAVGVAILAMRRLRWSG